MKDGTKTAQKLKVFGMLKCQKNLKYVILCGYHEQYVSKINCVITWCGLNRCIN